MEPSIIRRGAAARRAALVLLISTLATLSFPEAKKLTTLEEIAAAGVASSLDYAKARNAARKAQAAIPALFKAKSSALTTTYSYKGELLGMGSSGVAASEGLSASATIPLLDQVGLAASISKDLSTNVSATLSPLSHSDTRVQALISYEKTLAAVDDKGKAAGTQAVKAALVWMSQKRQLATQEKTTALKEESYNAAKASNAVDSTTTTLDDLVSALKDWSDARSALVMAQAAERKAETNLYLALGASRGDVDLAILDLDGLSAALSALETSLSAAASSGPAESYSAKAANLDVTSGRAKLDSIWAFEPNLSLNAGVSLPIAGSPFPSASVKLTISLDDLKGEDKAEARADLDIAIRTLALQKSSDVNAYDQAIAAVQTAKLNGESRKMARDQSAELADVADFSYKSGSYSALENEAAALALAAAEDVYFQAVVDEYGAWLDLAALAGR